MLPISISQLNYFNLKNILKMFFWSVIRFFQLKNNRNYKSIYILGSHDKEVNNLYIPSNVSISDKPNKDSIILITEFNLLKILKNILYLKRFRIVDKKFFLTSEASTSMRLWYCDFTSESNKKLISKSIEKNLKSFIFDNSTEALAVLGTGPSYSYAKEYFLKNRKKIITCNSAIYDDELWINGNASLCFADPVFHFGQSQEAIKFKKEVIKKFHNKPFYIIVPIECFPIVNINWGIDKNYIIGLKKGFHEFYKGQFGENINMKRTSNILTEFMIPLSIMLSKNILLGGFDGREKQETNFWKYDKEVNQDLSQHIKTHSSFFNDLEMLKYYEEHINILE